MTVLSETVTLCHEECSQERLLWAGLGKRLGTGLCLHTHTPRVMSQAMFPVVQPSQSSQKTVKCQQREAGRVSDSVPGRQSEGKSVVAQ